MADIVRAHEADLVCASDRTPSLLERRVLRDIARCRTAALGGHVEKCDRCSHIRVSYNSCRNRHCPKCQGSAREKWLSERAGELLPVQYFHVVFTIPHEVAAISLQNRKAIYSILFETSAKTVRQVAADPRHLGAEVGFLSVLHTWGQNLEHHPHVHLIVPGGGLSKDRDTWIPARDGFFLSVKVLARLFRGKFLAALKRLHRTGKLHLGGDLASLENPEKFREFMMSLYEKEWFVYSKPPFGGPEHVLKYLSRYTHRVAISNSRIVSFEDGEVSFLWKDYAHGCKRRIMTLSAVEFLRRFLTHVLPPGFVRIRHYGFLSNRHRSGMIELCRKLLDVKEGSSPTKSAESSTSTDRAEVDPPCPVCKSGRMLLVMTLAEGEELPEHLHVARVDTS